MSFTVGQPKQSGLGLVLGQLGAGIGAGATQSIGERLQSHFQEKKIESLANKFKAQGYPEDLARLAAAATTGGQTEVLKQVLETRQRGISSIKDSLSEDISPSEEFIHEDLDKGLIPKEKFRREEGRFAKQSDKYSDFSEKSNKLHQEQMRLQRLQELNEGGNLPKGLGRINVNLKSGELVLPFAASEDAQEFGKIVNDFLAGAKDTFGARVTNFEVNRFLRRLPSLLNSEEGRRRVLRDMEIINQINTLYNQAILDEFDERGGVRKVDLDVAERAARKKIDPLIKKLQKEYVSGQQEEKKESKITQDIAQDILREAKGNKELARKIAKKRGYEF